MKWIGQHIYDLVARFRNDVYLEGISTSTETNVLVVDSTGKISKSTTLADDIIEAEIDTLAGLTSIGTSGGENTVFSNAVNIYNTITSSSSQGGILALISNDGAALGDDHRLGALTFLAAEDAASTLKVGASIQAFADAAWSDTENGTRLLFRTMDGNAAGQDVLTLASDKLATFGGAVTVAGGIAGTLTTAAQGNITTLAGLTSIGTAGVDLTTTSYSIFDINRSSAQGNAGAENITALHVDFDRTVPDSGTYAHNDIGIKLDVDSASLGTSSLKGMDIDVSGATSGTSVATGIDLLVHRADTNYGIVVQSADTQLKLVANANDYATFSVADTGDLTIATVGDGSIDSDLILDADGQIKLEPAAGKNILLDGTVAVDAGAVTGIATLGATGENLELYYDDIQWYNAVNSGNPQFSFGSSAANRLVIWPVYDFRVDEVIVAGIVNTGINISTDKALTINGVNVISDSSGTATLSNIDALDATTLATINSKSRAYFVFNGFGTADGSNYEMPEIKTDPNHPFEHDTSAGSDGLTAQIIQQVIRGGGIVMPYTGVLKKFTGWVSSAGGGTVDVGLFKFTPTDDVAGNLTPVLLVNEQITASGNAIVNSFSETSSFDAGFTAGDIIYSAVKGDTASKTWYLNSTLEVEWS